MQQPDKEYLKSAVGPDAAGYYLPRFAKIDARGPWTPTWHWPAFLFSTAWFYRRGMSGYAFLDAFLFWSGLFALLGRSIEARLFGAAAAIILFVIVPSYANALYYRLLRKRAKITAMSLAGSGFAAAFTMTFAFVICLVGAMSGMEADYTLRAKMSEVVNVGGVCKTSVAEFYQGRGRMPASAAEAECSNAGTANSSAPQVNAGTIRVQAAGALRKRLEDEESGIDFQYTPVCEGGACTGARIVSWECKAGTTVARRFLPTMCR